MKYTFFSHKIGILILFLAIAGIQLTLMLYLKNREAALTPPGHVHAMQQLDTYYPDIIRQSYMGRWAVIDDHSTQPTPAVRGYVFFIVAGKIARLLSIEPTSFYDILKITGAVAVYLATFFLITQILPRALQGIAIITTLAIETGPLIADVISKRIFEWTPASASQIIVQRHFAFPHHLWGEALGLTTLTLVYICATRKHIPLLILIFILGFFGTVTLPPYFILITASILIPSTIYTIIKEKSVYLSSIISIVSVALAGLWTKYEFGKGPPWSDLVAIEKSWWTNKEVLIPFFQSFSLYYPFVLLALIFVPIIYRSLSNKTKLAFVMGAAWFVTPIGLILVSKIPWFPVANGRIATNLSPVPIGILSAIGIYAALHVFQHKKKLRAIFLTGTGLWIVLSLFLSVIYIKQIQIEQDKNTHDGVVDWTLYPSERFWEGIMQLKRIPAFSHVMLLPRTGELITAYIPIRAYQTQPLTFTNWIKRREVAGKFYSGSMNKKELTEFIRENGLSYVIYGPEESYEHPNVSLYPYALTVWYSNPEITIYEVKKEFLR